MNGYLGIVSSIPLQVTQQQLLTGLEETGIHSSDRMECSLGAHHILVALGSSRTTSSLLISNESRRIIGSMVSQPANCTELLRHLNHHAHQLGLDIPQEVILHLHEDNREDWQAGLAGSWSYVLLDGEDNSVYAAVDAFSTRSFFWYEIPGLILFGSHLPSLCTFMKWMLSQVFPGRSLPGVDINKELIPDLLVHSHLPSPQTLIRNIQALPSGKRLSWTPQQGTRIESYCSLTFIPKRLTSIPALLNDLHQHFHHILHLYLTSSLRTGICLDGSISAGLWAFLAAQAGIDTIKTYSIHFPRNTTTKSKHLPPLKEKIRGIEHVDILVDLPEPGTFIDFLEKLDIPVCRTELLEDWLQTRAASTYLDRVLYGHGGKEIWGADFPILLRHATRWLPRFQSEIHGKYFPRQSDTVLVKSRNRSALYDVWRFQDPDGALWSKLFLAPYHEESHPRPSDTEFLNDRDFFTYKDLTCYLPELRLRASNALAVLTRTDLQYPWLNPSLVSFVTHLPASRKQNGLHPYWLLERYFSEKFGFTLENIEYDQTVPTIRNLFKIPNWVDVFRSVLLDPHSEISRFVDLKGVRNLIENNLIGNKTGVSILWKLFTIEVWLKKNTR